MNQEPTQDPLNQFTFERESTTPPQAAPPAQPHTPSTVTPTHTAFKPVATGKLGRTSGVAMYLLAVVSGLLAIASASYLISTVLRYFLVEKNNGFMFFDLSSIDLYFIITTIIFGITFYVSMGLVQKGSSNVPLGFRRRHEIVGAIWQTILALFIIGSIITFIHSPLDMAINGTDGDKTAGSQLTATLLSGLFTLLLAASLLWRDRTLAKGTNALAPTFVSAALLIGVVVASVVMISLPKEEPETPDYSSQMNSYDSSSSSSSETYNFGTDTEDTDTSSSTFDSSTTTE